MGFLKNLASYFNPKNLTREEIAKSVAQSIYRNISGIVRPDSLYYQDESVIWTPAGINVRNFYRWLLDASETKNMYDNASTWMDRLIDEIEEYAHLAITHTYETIKEDGLSRNKFLKYLTISQVYSYCVQSNIIPLLPNGLPNPKVKYDTELIYCIYAETMGLTKNL